jgi:uncharacterized protein YdhG (YjbR/CyaY superfamily)
VSDKANESFSAAEREAMKERAKELKTPRSKKLSGVEDMQEKIAAMPPAEQKIAHRLNALITQHAPELGQKTWYGMPAWEKNGKVICFFQAASKFTTRYSTLGFNESAHLDDGDMWPTAFALVNITPAVEKHIIELIKKAAG